MNTNEIVVLDIKDKGLFMCECGSFAYYELNEYTWVCTVCEKSWHR